MSNFNLTPYQRNYIQNELDYSGPFTEEEKQEQVDLEIKRRIFITPLGPNLQDLINGFAGREYRNKEATLVKQIILRKMHRGTSLGN